MIHEDVKKIFRLTDGATLTVESSRHSQSTGRRWTLGFPPQLPAAAG